MTKRDSNIVKGVAILCMLFHHLFYQADRYNTYGFTGLIGNAELTLTIAKDMKVCVAIFAFITGFGMVKKVQASEKSRGQVALGIRWHITNILISYLVLIKDTVFIMLITLPISAVLGLPRQPEKIWGEGAYNFLKGTIANMTGMAGFINVEWFIRSWWYLKVAILFMCTFPIIYEIIKSNKTFIVAVVICYIAAIFYEPSIFTLDTILRYFPAFFLGVSVSYLGVAELLKGWKNKSTLNSLMFAMILVVIYAISVYAKHHTKVVCLTQAVQALLISLFAMLYVAEIPQLSKIIHFIGVNSKFMWLIHVYIYGQLLREGLFSLRNIWLIFGVLIILSLIAAIVFRKTSDWIFIRLPFAKKIAMRLHSYMTTDELKSQ